MAIVLGMVIVVVVVALPLAVGATLILGGKRLGNTHRVPIARSAVQSGDEDVHDVRKLRAVPIDRPRSMPTVSGSTDSAAAIAGEADRHQDGSLMLRGSVLGIPIAVHWSFAFIGILAIDAYSIDLVVAFVVGVFIAVLSHELGHALTARAFGAKSVTITLFGLGGLTQYPANTPLTPGRRFLIAASGSAVGMSLGGSVYLIRNTEFARELFDFGRVIGLGIVIAGLLWGALNWLPILPLDGGNMSWHALEAVAPKYALRIAKVLTVVTTGIVIYLALNVWDNTFGAVFIGIIALQGLQIPERDAPARRRPLPTKSDEASLLSIFDDRRPES